MSYILTYNNRPITRTLGANNFIRYGLEDVWVPVTFQGNINIENGWNVWHGYSSVSDDPVYYGSTYELTSHETWSNKSWSGLTSFSGSNIWRSTDNKIYLSSYNDGQYVLNGSTWTTMTWSGVSKPYRSGIWTDGRYDYYQSSKYRSGSSWYNKTWTWADPKPGTFDVTPADTIWKDADGTVYWSHATTHYVLNGSTWSKKTWIGIDDVSVDGDYIWHDLSGRTFYSQGSKQYQIDSTTSTWTPKTWGGLTPSYGYNIWNDGHDIYYTYNSVTYKLT